MKKSKTPVTDLAARLFCLVVALVALWLALRYLLPILLPFLIAWGVAILVRVPAQHLHRHTRLSERVLRLVLALSLIAACALVVGLAGVRLVGELRELLARLASAGAGDPLAGVFSAFPALAESELGAWLSDTLHTALASLASALPSLLSRLVSAAPRALVALLVSLFSCVYFCLDLERMSRAALPFLPPSVRARCQFVRLRLRGIGAAYLRSYLTLMGITFAEMLIGLLWLRVDYALLLALLIALVDLFPVLGVGTVLVPWSAFSFLMGDTGRGVALLILWGVSLAVRQFAEPRLIGKGLGIHPCLTLLAMYAGLSLFGVAGMLLLPPVAALFFASLPRAEMGDASGCDGAPGGGARAEEGARRAPSS